jgi:hypothetical protein
MTDPGTATLLWHYEDGTWWAESPEYPEWTGGAESLDEARLLAHGGLRWLGAQSVIDPFTMPLANVSGSHD